MYIWWKFIVNTVEKYACISLWEEKYGHDFMVFFSMIQFWKQSFRGKYKELRTRIWTENLLKKTQNCKFHHKTSSFRSLNNLVEKYKVHRSIQLFERIFLAFFRVNNGFILKMLRHQTVWVQNSCFLPWYFPSFLSSFFPTMRHYGSGQGHFDS